jgi:hypothetical protein
VGYQDGDIGIARLNSPSSIAVAEDGGILISDTNNHCIRRLSPGLKFNPSSYSNNSWKWTIWYELFLLEFKEFMNAF